MKLKPATPLMLTKLGCPLAFDVVDAGSSIGDVIGRATFIHWHQERGVIEYTVKIQRGDRCLTGPLYIAALQKL